jgi:uncharacterized membrane protein
MCPLSECPQCGTSDIMISFPKIKTKPRSEVIKERDMEKKEEKMNWKKKLHIAFYVILILGVIGAIIAIIGMSLYFQNLINIFLGVELPIITAIIIVIILLIFCYLKEVWKFG